MSDFVRKAPLQHMFRDDHEYSGRFVRAAIESSDEGLELVAVVRCKDCRHSHKSEGIQDPRIRVCTAAGVYKLVMEDAFCSTGMRRVEGE